MRIGPARGVGMVRHGDEGPSGYRPRTGALASWVVTMSVLAASPTSAAGLSPHVREQVDAILAFRPSASHGYPALYTQSSFLPQWCDSTADGATKKRDLLESYFVYYGEAFAHLHHYCRGLYAFHVAVSEWRDGPQRVERLRRSIVEFDYVLTRTGARFPLRAEILTKKGAALLALEQPVDAVRTLQEAIAAREDYVPAYIALSNCFRRVGDDAEARRILEAAQRQAPDMEILARKLAELEGEGP